MWSVSIKIGLKTGLKRSFSASFIASHSSLHSPFPLLLHLTLTHVFPHPLTPLLPLLLSSSPVAPPLSHLPSLSSPRLSYLLVSRLSPKAIIEWLDTNSNGPFRGTSGIFSSPRNTKTVMWMEGERGKKGGRKKEENGRRRREELDCCV